MTQQPPNIPTRLDAWLLVQTDGFPRTSIEYPVAFKAVSSYLNRDVHPHVEKGPLITGEGYLTDHGPDHVATVIERAGDLLAHPSQYFPKFTPYEIYLLLMAIHFHDIGNIFGRKGHETRHAEVMAHVSGLLAGDAVERRAILQIARAHGGYTNGDKDTIAGLPTEAWVMGQSVRYQALAAVLRFADELADDSRRAARAIVALGLLPAESEVFHAYAGALHSVAISPANRTIDLRYNFNRDQTALLGKGHDRVYLLDEIYARTVKMHYEREYCMRFTRDFLRIDAIDVQILIYQDHNSIDPHLAISYRLAQRGYPGDHRRPITELLPPEAEHLVTGDELHRSLAG